MGSRCREPKLRMVFSLMFIITAPNSINSKHYVLHDLLKHTRMINIQTLQVKSLLQKTMKREYLKNSFSSP